MEQVEYINVRTNETLKGFFRAWGTDYEELRDGVGIYTVGIIQNLDGTIVTVYPTNIKFIL